MTGKRVAIYAAISVASVGLTACSSDTEGTKPKMDSLATTVNEATDLQNELNDVVRRLVVDCMEGKDFDVHPLWMTESSPEVNKNDSGVVGELLDPNAFDVPTLKAAKKEGFGNNIQYFEEPDDSKTGKDSGNDPFYEESEDYRESYDKAMYGEEYYDWMNGNSADTGADDSDDSMTFASPLEGGCKGEVNKLIYGEPITPDPKDAESEGVGPHYGVDYPAALTDYEGLTELYETEKLIGSRDDLAKCIEDAGYPYFEYIKKVGLGISAYVNRFYADQVDALKDEGAGYGMPEYDLPKGAPWDDRDKAFEAEVKLAVTVANCADDTGFRKTSKQAWDDAIDQNLKDSEEEVYAWYDDIKAALEKAQDLVGK